MTEQTTKCPACNGTWAHIKQRRGGFYLECGDCHFQGPTTATVDQATAGARRWAMKRNATRPPDQTIV